MMTNNCPFKELKRRFRGQLPPEKHIRRLIQEGERFPFDIPERNTRDNDVEYILQIHRQTTGWAVPSEKFFQWLLSEKR
jgi:hypothetical protein